jgi:glyoxylase-like metal-dependent hydrolase (beta-lactamase superfamily II)
MLLVDLFTFNPFQENTYIVSNEQKQCWIIDPGMSNRQEEEAFLNFIQSKEFRPQAIINTHAHIDHILGIDFVSEKYSIPFYLHEKELPILNNASNTAKMFGFDYKGVATKPILLRNEKEITLGKENIEIKLVPGHSPGSIALYSSADKWVISGDALFQNSIGRTDLMMGDYDTLIHSIQSQLMILEEETTVYSGHGDTTKIGIEKNNNPFLQ